MALFVNLNTWIRIKEEKIMRIHADQKHMSHVGFSFN